MPQTSRAAALALPRQRQRLQMRWPVLLRHRAVMLRPLRLPQILLPILLQTLWQVLGQIPGHVRLRALVTDDWRICASTVVH